jgi:hypothetical protein
LERRRSTADPTIVGHVKSALDEPAERIGLDPIRDRPITIDKLLT